MSPVMWRRRLRWCIVVSAATAACGSAATVATAPGGGSGFASTTQGGATSATSGEATPAASATVAGSAAPPPATATPVPTATPAQLIAVIDRLYPPAPGGGYAVCDTGEDQSFPNCPFSARLLKRVQDIYAQQRASPGPGYADPVCGCQNFSQDRSVSATADAAGGGDARVTMFGGSDHINVVIVASGGRLLVDDINFCSETPPVSIYADQAARC